MRPAVLAIALLAALAWPASAQDRGIAHGKALVQLNCSGCHAIGKTDESSHPGAPPFRTLHERYPLDALEEAFVEGIVTGHPDMPEFQATPDQIADILDYIASLNP